MANDDPRGQQRLGQRLPPRRVYTAGNRFEYDESRRPADVVYQWNRVTLAGQEDPENCILNEQNGWSPVPSERHPELSGSRAAKGGEIVRGGLRLEQIPKQYAQEGQQLDQFAARQVVESQIQRLGLEARQNGRPGVRRERRTENVEEIP